MKRISAVYGFFAVLLTVVFSCKPDAPLAEEKIVECDLRGTTENIQLTKSYIQSDMTRWSGEERVLVASSEDFSDEFVLAPGSSVGLTATFHGRILEKTKKLYAVYPASAASSLDYAAGSMEINVPSTQIVGPHGICEEALVCVAQCEPGKNLSFKQVCGFVKVDISREDAVAITVSGRSLAGKTVVSAEGVMGGVNGSSSNVVLKKKDGGVLAPGSYYLVLLPGTSPAGEFKVMVSYSDGSSDCSAASESVTVKRGVCVDYGDIKSDPAPTPDPEPEPVDPDHNETIQMALVRATNSTAVIAWTLSEANVPYLTELSESYDPAPDADKRYKVCLYKDKACSELVVGWEFPVKYSTSATGEATTVLFQTKACPRFIFTGLQPSTKYYATVTDMDGGATRKAPFEFSTKARHDAGYKVVTTSATVGDYVLSESFDRFLWGGDITSCAAGYSRYDRSSITSVEAAAAKGNNPPASDSQFYPVSNTTEMGLFNTMAKVMPDLAIDDWGWIAEDNTISAICLRPGYVKVGANSKHSSLVTPRLSAIPSGREATVTVTFKMASYGSFPTYDEAEKVMSVKVLDGTTIDSDRRISVYTVTSESPTINIEGDGVWKTYTVSLTGVTATSRIAFGGTRPGTGVQSRFHIDDIAVRVDALATAEGPHAEGYVRDSAGNPQAGITVSDGFRVTVTDSKGYYHLQTCSDTWYIYISLPADAKIAKNSNGSPDFFKKYSSAVTRYDFSYEKQAVEKQFSLFAMADPQAHYAKRSPQKIADTDRFNQETVPALNAHISSKATPCYGVTLGDIVYSENGRNSNSGMPTMRSHFAKVNMPVFQTMGNHDFTYFYTSSPLTTDATSSTLYLKAQRKFEDCFGPINYSFNRGEVHVVCLRDINYNNTTDNGSYVGGFTDEQWAWLQADLANVPKSKMVIICVHIPLVSLSSGNHVKDALNLIKQYTNSRVFSGHTHYTRNTPNCLSTGVYEHVHPAVCGQWWWSNISGDGCPNGYSVYDFDGTQVKDWYFMGVNKGMDNRENQMRLYRGNAKVGGPYAYFQMPHSANKLFINIFNADDNWRVKVYENGVFSGNATKMATSKANFSSVTAGQTYNIPASSNQDWWCIGYHIGIVGRGTSNTSYYTNQYHMYQYDLKDASASVRVEATDSFGRVYTATEIVTDSYSDGNYPAYFAPGNNY